MVRLGDVCRFINGDRGKNYPSQAEISSNGDIPFINAGHIVGGKLNFSEMNYISEKKYDQLNSGKVQENDILYCLRGSLGKKAIVKNISKGVIASSLLIIRPDSQILNSDYLFFALESPSVQEQMMQANNGSSQPNLSAKSVSDYTFYLPDIKDQLEVVAKLTKINNLIALREEQLAKLDELVKSRFIELFGDPFNNKKWDTQKLRNISVSISDGSNVDKTYYEDKGDVLFLRIQNVWFNEFRLDDSVYISEDVNNEYLDTSLHHGDLLITKIGRYYTKDSSLGRVSVYLGEDDKANYSNNIMRVRLTDEVCSEFVNILMNLDDYNRYIREVSVGGTDKRALSKAIIGDLPIIMPPKELQFEFLEFVRQTDKSKLDVQQSLNKLKLLKKALMQKYFG